MAERRCERLLSTLFYLLTLLVVFIDCDTYYCDNELCQMPDSYCCGPNECCAYYSWSSLYLWLTLAFLFTLFVFVLWKHYIRHQHKLEQPFAANSSSSSQLAKLTMPAATSKNKHHHHHHVSSGTCLTDKKTDLYSYYYNDHILEENKIDETRFDVNLYCA